MCSSDLQTGAPGSFVFLVNADRNAVTVRKVATGPADGSHTVVTQGLVAGDTVVVDGVDRLSDGARVALQGAAPQAAKAADTVGTPAPAPAPAPAR